MLRCLGVDSYASKATYGRKPKTRRRGVCKQRRSVLSVTPIQRMLTTSSPTARSLGKSFTIYGLGKILKGGAGSTGTRDSDMVNNLRR
jgi:hypothetical protein